MGRLAMLNCIIVGLARCLKININLSYLLKSITFDSTVYHSTKSNYMKPILLTIAFFFILNLAANAQLKKTAQMATLSPILLVAHGDIENYKKMHYMISTISYIGLYSITESMWKSAVMTLAMGVFKEIVYDSILGRGEPLWEDMKWNSLGTAQGIVFTVSLRF